MRERFGEPQVVDSSDDVHFPKLAYKTWLSCSPYSNQSLTRQRVIPFPIELRSLQAGSHFSASRE
jgi:hypothetical protein